MSTILVVFIDKRVSHETMLEALALGVETRAMVVRWGWSHSRGRLDSVVVAASDNQDVRYRGQTPLLREWLHRAVRECLDQINR